MIELDADVAILGSGFAGSLCGMILARGGLHPVVIDRAAHPRFAIGESSTPIANFVLRDLARHYDLAALLPLTKYGTWQAHCPEIVCGLKRGFSYFHHRPQEEFRVRRDHGNELLVAASHSDEHSDTHWLRADVDARFAQELVRLGVPLLERTNLTLFQQLKSPHGLRWELTGQQAHQTVRVRCQFVIDGSGEGGVLPKALGIRVSQHGLATRSRAVFSHFRQLGSWSQWLDEREAAIVDHPFCCDNAAQHQLLDGAWMWVLRFNNGVTSAGFAIDAQRFPQPAHLSADQEWNRWLDRYPSVASIFRRATIVDPPAKILRSGILPRRAARAVGKNWALLPHTAGFIDPLHSTGIAHSLCGVERLTGGLIQHWNRETLPQVLLDYERAVFGELVVMDRLVSGCYRALPDFRLFVAYSMLYFAAATWYEHQRRQFGGTLNRWFLCADDEELCRIVEEFHDRVVSLTNKRVPTDHDILQIEKDVAAAIRPYNIVGLCDPQVHNMYRYTAPEN